MTTTLAQELGPANRGRTLQVAAIALLFVAVYAPALVILHRKYSEIDSYYSHGYLIPLVSAFIVWYKRRRLAGIVVAPAPAGLWVLAAGLLLNLFAEWWHVNVVSDLSMLVVIVGIVLYLFGKVVARELAFPMAFLSFMIPLPKISIIYITFWLKLYVAWAATEIVGATGVPLLLEGAFIHLPNRALEVDNACSGLRSLIALTAMGVTYAYFLRVSPVKKLVVAVSAIPIALAANVLRIIIVVGVTYRYNPAGRAFEITDFTTGYLVFVVALVGVFAISKIVEAVDWGGTRVA
jgi:exosortase